MRLKLGSDNYQSNDSKGQDPKHKAQQGGSVVIFIKERVKWPHEFVYACNTKDRVTYNQLSITQWMAGFCRILRDENCQKLLFFMTQMIFRGRQPKLAMLYCYAVWNRVR